MTLHPGDSCVNNWMLKAMAKDAGFLKHKRITNHSVRKFLVQKLRNANIPPTETMAITGHKNSRFGKSGSIVVCQRSHLNDDVPRSMNARSHLNDDVPRSMNARSHLNDDHVALEQTWRPCVLDQHHGGMVFHGGRTDQVDVAVHECRPLSDGGVSHDEIVDEFPVVRRRFLCLFVRQTETTYGHVVPILR
ncbi:hypothetical protein DPMN_114011 [Dreissena polymorpha]|uniref:Tyr recombinase domain-containing protein n=1 Tax=Dreissena polymorpha TaxID=45954 RepID=A0A9D4KJ41_DREPO|nr:hypothetical protein DPMN_114011 [Dreissena polymorpha]